MRSVAVLAVLLDHVMETLGAFRGFNPTPFAWYAGRIGVLLFFVLTSLVLLQSLERSARAGQASSAGFFVRRAFRIYPLSLVCVAAVLLLGVPGTAWEAVRRPIGTLQLVSNFALTQNLTYSESILGPLWSLPYELQMYLFLPAVFWLVDRARSVRSALGLWILGVLSALVQPEIAGRLDVAQYAPCFLAGAVAYALGRRFEARLPFSALPLGLAALLAAYVALAGRSGEVHPRWVGWALCLAVGTLLPFVTELRSRWPRAAFREIAKYSYGVYLFHMIALWIGFNRLGREPFALQCAAALSLLVLLPVAGHHLVEKPGIAAGARLARRLATRRSAASAVHGSGG